jgi:PAS domain S-box-containing protein
MTVEAKMRSDLFAQEIAAMRGRITVLHQHRGASPEQPDIVADAAIQALDTTMEELRVTVEELSRKNEELVALQQTLEQERIRYRELFDQAPDGYVVTDLKGVIREANRAASALLNIDTKFLIGKPLLVFIPESKRAMFRAALLRLRDTPKTAEYDLRFQPRHEAPVDVTLRVSVAYNAQGEPIAFRWLIRDVTARRQAEEKIRELNAALERRVVERSEQLESALQHHEHWLFRAHAATAEPEAREQLFEDLVQEVDAILWTMDAATGRYTFVSRRAESILGYPVERWLGDPGFWANHIHPDDREWAVAHRRRQLSEGRDLEAEYRLTAADGRDVWFRESVRILKDEHGRARELCGLMVNISRRKKVERQLYTAKSHLAARLEDMTSLYELGLRLVGQSELESVLQEVLASLTSLLGTDQGAVFLDDREHDSLRLVAGIGLPEAFATRGGHLPRRGGELGSALAAVAPVFVEDVEDNSAHPELKPVARAGGFRAVFSYPLLTREGEFLGTIAVFFRDHHRPTERQVHLMGLYARQAADFLENGRLRGEAEDSDRRKGEFLALIAHELRNPIGTILNALHVLEPEGHDITTLDHTREVIERQTRHMAQLVDDLIDATRLRTGKLELHKERINLAPVVARAVEAIQPLLVARNHRLSVELPSDPLPLLADPTRLEQILINLLNNAAKYTEPGGRITLEAKRRGDEVIIRVRDNGIGIAPELLPRVFDLYMQVNPGTERSAKGLGIGLWLVRRLVERHGGSISAHSEGPGLGSEFVVRLPIDPSGADHPPALPADATMTAPPAAQTQRSRRVLIVDDHPDSAHVLARLVRRWNHEASVVLDGPSALEEARRFHPDIVLLDIKLPGMDGYELARRLRESPGGIGMALVGLSGAGNGRNGQKHAAPEFDHQLVKPVDPATLRRLIEEKPASSD